MSVLGVQWRRVIHGDAGVGDDIARTCFLTKIFHFSEGRNAYMARWSVSSNHEHTYSLDKQSLLNDIEYRRKQGSQFTLVDIPAVVLRGAEYDLLVFQLIPYRSPDMPRRTTIRGCSIREIALSTFPPGRYWCNFVSAPRVAVPAEFPFLQRTSRSLGRSYALDWTAEKTDYDLALCLRIVLRISRHLQKQR